MFHNPQEGSVLGPRILDGRSDLESSVVYLLRFLIGNVEGLIAHTGRAKWFVEMSSRNILFTCICGGNLKA